MKVLFVGDVCGSIGVRTCKAAIEQLTKVDGHVFDFIVVNGENAAGGLGITYPLAKDFFQMGVDAITLGNHTWSRKEILNFIEDERRMVRPANYPANTPGQGSTVLSKNGKKLGVINVLGLVYMDPNDCPFMACDRELVEIKKQTRAVLVDMHAEATSEKCALAWHLDGRVSAVIGTHTHVQTADERILDCGTGFLSDAGMTGPYEGVIGMDREAVLKKFTTHIPERYETAKGRTHFNGVILEIDETNGKCIKIERVQKLDLPLGK